jgi:hypothetical protein
MRIALVLLMILGAEEPRAEAHGRTKVLDTLRYAYTAGMVYRIRLSPGSPFVIDLPTGEEARNLWADGRYWSAESTEGSSRVVIRALGSTDIVGKRGLIHIETKPSDLRISLKVEAVDEGDDVPAAMQLYFEGSSAQDPIRHQVRKEVDAQLVLARKQAEEKARADFEAWTRQTLATFRADYDWGGDFRVSRVVSNRLVTYVTVPDASDKAVMQYVNKAGKTEIVNFELSNGTYAVQKVLQPGEKLRLILGKEQAWVALRK